MIPYKQLLKIDKQAEIPVYLQIANQIIHLIQEGVLKPGLKLPGSRSLSTLLEIHRQTVVRALDELEIQAWVEVVPYKGTFISNQLPQVKARAFKSESSIHQVPSTPNFNFYAQPHISKNLKTFYPLSFNDGVPDARLAPIAELATAYSRNIRNSQVKGELYYGDHIGSRKLRETLSAKFNTTRGMNSQPENVMITRGSVMAVSLSAMALLKKGDTIIVGERSYPTGNLVFENCGANIQRIGIDDNGLQVSEIEAICKKQKVKAVYVTSHHHHPTTVTLSPERRLKLLDLANQYHFAILEDDYDYNFHYGNSPLLPLASADRYGNVIYIGSFSKTIAPAIRVGYVFAPQKFIDELLKLRRLIDYQGDLFLENAIADLIEGGILRRHLRRSLNHYRERRDHLSDLLKATLGDQIQFNLPEGGMAIWANFDKAINLVETSKAAAAKGLYISDGRYYHPHGKAGNATRMGFASMNLKELEQAVEILKATIQVSK